MFALERMQASTLPRLDGRPPIIRVHTTCMQPAPNPDASLMSHVIAKEPPCSDLPSSKSLLTTDATDRRC